MPHLHGFCKTLRLPVLVPAPITNQLQATTDLFRQVVEYYLRVFAEHLEVLDNPRWLGIAEKLTHRTIKNPAPLYHDFDALFPCLPSGFRRAAIAASYGLALAWRENYRRWQRAKLSAGERNERRAAVGKKPIRFTERPPQFPETSRSWLTYYGTEFKVLDERHLLFKVATGTTYIYRKVALARPWEIPAGYAAGSPTLVQKKNGWEVHIPLFLQERRDLRPAAALMQDPATRICAVDLGLNHHAVMTIQDAEGRVLATEFISGAKDNHLRKQYLERIARLQKKTGVIPEGERFAKDLWDKVKNLVGDIAHQVSRRIVDLAAQHGAKIIVFEHLKNLRPEKGTRSHRMNQKLGYWVKGRIFQYTQYKALHQGIIVSRVSPRDTSRRCPDCGFLSIERYLPGKPHGVTLAQCSNCSTHGVHADWLATRNIGQKFRLRYA
jgi:IS605 OrfB family transposase